MGMAQYKMIPINCAAGEISRAILAHYFKSGAHNLLDRKDGYAETGVKKINIMDEQDFRIRKLTERECFRLMGVRDNDIDTIRQSGVSKSQQYKMAGNSIVCDVMMGIFTNLFNTDDEYDDLF